MKRRRTDPMELPHGQGPMPAALASIASALLRLAPADGSAATAIPFLWLSRRDRPTPLRHGVLAPSACFVLQGEKTFHVGDRVVDYGAGAYLTSTIDMPAAGRVVTASRARPYLGVRIEVTAEEVAAVVADARIDLGEGDGPPGAAFVGQLDVDAVLALERLVRLLDRPRDADFLAPALKREIVYRMLTGPSGLAFHRNVMLDARSPGVGRALAFLRDHFDERVKVDDLARRSHMSVSSLQHKFKAITTMGPLQYQKRLRLEEARRRLLAGGADATSAAFAVGYESPSQFSREYRRLFGLPPSKDAKQARTTSPSGDI